MSNYNVAVCLSGQPRTWRSAKENLRKYFDRKTNVAYSVKERVHVDYFIHTWDVNSYRDKSQPRSENENFSNTDEQDIRDEFLPTEMEYEKFIEDWHLPTWSGLFYSFMKSVYLKRQYELENDFVYDLVIKTRFDVNFLQTGTNPLGKHNSIFHFHPIVPLTIYTPTHQPNKFPMEFGRSCLDDVWFYSDSPTMDLISNLWKSYRRTQSAGDMRATHQKYIQDTNFYQGPGTLLYDYCSKFGVQVVCRNEIPYYIVRKEAGDQNLHSLRDWEKIRSISEDWYNTQVPPSKVDNIHRSDDKHHLHGSGVNE